MSEYFPLLMFPALLLAILSGFPVAFVLTGVGLLFGLIGHYCFDLFILSDFGFISSKVFGVFGNVTLMAVPLFIFMGIALEKSGIADELLQASAFLLRKIRGGMLFGIVIVGALLAASTGIVGATVVTMAALTIPTIERQKYNVTLSAGTICAAGTLGQIIPPSIVLILLADMMNIAVADLFAGAVIPGLLLIVCYLLYITYQVIFFPADFPPYTHSKDSYTLRTYLAAILPPVALIFLVLGSILFGIASPTESAGCGALAALCLALLKRKLQFSTLFEIAKTTTTLTAMVFTLLIGAQVFSVVFRGMYGDDILLELLSFSKDNPYLLLISVMAIFFVLGFFLDFLEICFIFVPIIGPLLTTEMGFNPIWIAILIAINLQTSFLTPPFGFSLFYFRGVAPESITTTQIYKGAIPFVLIQLVVLILIIFIPSLVTWLPNKLW